jgi:hypothetical protein
MPNEPEVIRITRDEVESSHVDDLLKRQMSLRGESGVTRDRRRAWYYQNWFVFMLVGMLAAIGAWAIIEPFFDDQQYWQGVVEKVDTNDAIVPFVLSREKELPAKVFEGDGSITIRGEKIFFLPRTKEIRADGSTAPLDLSTIKKGDEVGIYIHLEPLEKDVDKRVLALGTFLLRSPAPQKPVDAALTMEQLASRSTAAAMLLFPVVAALVGLAIGAIDGLICRLPPRALLSGGVGLLIGFIGGFVSHILAGLVYTPLNKLAMGHLETDTGDITGFGMFVQMIGRGTAWMLAGVAMGLGQGIALRSKRLLLYGLIGGVVGGLLGGLLFDPLDLLLLGRDKPSAHWARFAGIAIIGACVGAMIGVVELLARDAWLRMTQGPLAGKEFLIFKDLLKVGSSPRSDIYLFNDPAVAAHHATIRALGEECEIEASSREHPLLVNDRVVKSSRLRHGDQITIGKTMFLFQKKGG